MSKSESTQMINDSEARVAFDLAVKIQAYERPNQSPSNHIKSLEARKYWMRLYHQCLTIVQGGDPEQFLSSNDQDQ